MIQDSHVAAVVVTFNRLEKLQKGIAAIRASDLPPRTIVIVDNASTDGTDEYLRTIAGDEDVHVLSLTENTGGAGGFSAGMERAYQLGADFFWVMDDDCYPEPEALRRLLEEHAAVEEWVRNEEQSRREERVGLEGPGASDEPRRDRVPFACSVIKYIDGNLCEMNEAVTTWDWPRYHVHGYNAVKVNECTFVSALFPRWTVEEHGLPLTEYFIWFDDKEFTKRLSARSGLAGIQVLDSYAIHDMPGENRGVNYGQINEQNVWKFEYGVRNQSSFRWIHEGRVSWLNYLRWVTLKMRQGDVPKPLRRRIRRALLNGRKFKPVERLPSSLDPR
ncbi:glycosyltransferase family 2 protein [Aeromicrobium sp. CF4.19]|uniref:glycosyltransferase family 2 protein n=1 Tax=Aeromicrobium sp. CF4.19 TaxID=3373082 RepID=UPI003EE563D5